MAYDPNWLMKERAKRWKQQEKNLSHIEDKTRPHFTHSTMLCGKGWGAKGSPSITTVMFPSITSLPTCRTCREIFLNSIGVEINNETGYPL
jgi:hypothetical protein